MSHTATLLHIQELTNQRSPHSRKKVAQNRALLYLEKGLHDWERVAQHAMRLCHAIKLRDNIAGMTSVSGTLILLFPLSNVILWPSSPHTGIPSTFVVSYYWPAYTLCRGQTSNGRCFLLSSVGVVCRLHGGPPGDVTRAGQAMMSCRLQSNYSFSVTHGQSCYVLLGWHLVKMGYINLLLLLQVLKTKLPSIFKAKKIYPH